MSIFKKNSIQTQARSAIREISAIEAHAVGGGDTVVSCPAGQHAVVQGCVGGSLGTVCKVKCE